jgi:hypothetical protein
MIVAARYRVMGLLGGEGDGAVWHARDELLHRDVAMKEVRLAPELEVVAAREAVGHRRVTIAGIHDLVEEDGRTWLVMGIGDGGRQPVVIANRRRRVPVWVAVGVVAVLVGVSLAGITVLRGDGEATRVDAPAGGPGRFVAQPKPCDLVTGGRLSQLFPEAHEPYIVKNTPETCTWAATGELPARLQPVLRLDVTWFPPGSAESARADLYYEGLRSPPVRDLSGIGDEAFLSEQQRNGTFIVLVVFRMSNLVVRTSYNSQAEDDAFGTLRRGATSAAKVVADSLGRL